MDNVFGYGNTKLLYWFYIASTMKQDGTVTVCF